MAIFVDISGQMAGTWTIEDDGTPGNGTSIVRRPDGTIFTTFAHPADSVTIISTAGQSINVNITDSLTTANFTIGSLTVPAQNPDSIQIGGVLTSGTVTLAARNAITEFGSDAASDIIAGKLLLEAGSGIGAFNAIETQISVLEAESVTGGINLSNINNLTIGGAGGTADLRGLWSGTSGNIRLVNQGSITLSDDTGIESVRSAGDLTLQAIGATADISSNVDQDALLAVGNILLTAGRDVLFGTIGANFDNDVRAGGSISINAGRDFHIDGFSDMASDDQGAASNGGVTITVGRDILIEDDTGTDASIAVSATGSTGAVVLTTGIGGTLSLAATSSAAIQGRVGGVIINADRMLVENDSGINVSGAGALTIATASVGRGITLGVATDGVTDLELSDAELDRFVAQNVFIGDTRTGFLSVDGALTHANNNLTLRSGGDLFLNASITTAQTLTLLAMENILQSGGTLTTGNLTAQVDQPNDDSVIGGIATFNGIFAASGGAFINGNNDADTLSGPAGYPLVIHGNGGGDTIYSSGFGSYFGDAGDDLIYATPGGAEVLDGGSGTDTLDTTSWSGIYVINLATGTTNYAGESFVNFENLVSGSGNDSLTGSVENNLINGGGGNDVIDGASGNDTMIGGLGDDTFYADVFSDIVTEVVGQGNDRVQALNSYTLTAGSSIEILESTNISGTGAQNLSGNELAQTITGNNGFNILEGFAGNDTLNGNGGDDYLSGGTGNDTMDGGAGNDVYFVDSLLDQVNEPIGLGNDRIATSITYTLNGGTSIETLETVSIGDTTAIDLTGNALNQTIIGNNGINILTGGGGSDVLIGAGDNDFLVGNAAAATQMQGGTGDDTFYVFHSSDLVVEASAAGNDRVAASVNYTLSAGAHVEVLETPDAAGVTAIGLAGNELAQTITGNAGANRIAGAGGTDVLQGLGGNDTLIFSTALGAGNVDTILGFVTGADKIELKVAIFTQVGVGVLPAGAFKVGAAANEADDRIIYNSGTGALLYDADGDGAGAAVQFATLAGAPALAASDFVVV